MTAREIEAALKRWKDPFGHILKLFVRIWTNDNLNKLRKKCLINAIDLHLMHSSNLLRRLNELVTSGTGWIHWLQSNKLNLWNGVEFNAYRAWCVSEDNCSYGFTILIVDVQIYPDFFVFVYSQWIPYQRMVWLAFAYSDGIVMHWLWLIRNAHLIHIYIFILIMVEIRLLHIHRLRGVCVITPSYARNGLAFYQMTGAWWTRRLRTHKQWLSAAVAANEHWFDSIILHVRMLRRARRPVLRIAMPFFYYQLSGFLSFLQHTQIPIANARSSHGQQTETLLNDRIIDLIRL